MQYIFYTLLQMSVTASILSIFLLMAKYFMQKLGISRRVTSIIWLVIAFRLLCPVSVSSGLSILNVTYSDYQPPRWQTISEVTAYISENTTVSILPTIMSGLWLTGTLSLIAYMAISCCLLKRRLRFAVKLADNVYLSDAVPSPFVFGIIRPKIYLNEGCGKDALECVAAHERTHIKRGDHILKLFAFVVLSLHWFNPFVWLMFRLFSQDMELACDEACVRKMDPDGKRKYLDTLLLAATDRQSPFIFKVCFGSSPAKKRVKNILSLKKHYKWLSISGFFLCIILGVLFATNALPPIVHYSLEKPYSYKNNLHDKVYNFYCKDNGEISIYFDVNAAHQVSIIITDAKTGEEVDAAYIMAGGNKYTFSELVPKRAYNIEMQGRTGSEWKIEGHYIID